MKRYCIRRLTGKAADEAVRGRGHRFGRVGRACRGSCCMDPIFCRAKAVNRFSSLKIHDMQVLQKLVPADGTGRDMSNAKTRPENVKYAFCTKCHKPDFTLAVADAAAMAAAATAHGGVLSPCCFRHAAHRAATR